MKKLFDKIRKRRDERFLRRLERVLNENVLDTSIRVSGDVYVGVQAGPAGRELLKDPKIVED